MEWTEETALKLIENYKLYKHLWDPKDREYFKKEKKVAGWNKIARAVGKSAESCKKKVASLLATYRKERNKVIKSSIRVGAAGEGQVYSTRWFAYEAFQFLEERYVPRMVKRLLNETEEVPEITAENDDSETLPTPQPTESQIPEPPTKLRRRNPPDLQEAALYVKEAINTLNTALQKIDSYEDDCDLYGKMLANKLRRLSETERLQFMYEIDGMFICRQSNRIQDPLYGPSPYPSPHPSHHSDTLNRPPSIKSCYSEPMM